MRTIGSTLVGEGIDSLLFVSVAFFGVIPNEVLPGLIVSMWLIKSGYEAVATPLTYAVVGWVKHYEALNG